MPGMIGAFNNPARLEMPAEKRWADPVVGQLVPNRYADAIRALFKLRASGGSWSECCKLFDERIPREDGCEWLSSTVQTIIRNPVYKGEASLRSKGRQDCDIVKLDAHEPIVDALLWKAAQPKQGKPRRTSDGALLSGVLRCACCGRRLTPSTGRYRCRPRMVLGEPCDAPANVRADEVDALATRDFLAAVAYRPAAPNPPDPDSFERAVTVAKAGVARWQEAAVAGTVEPEVFGPAIAARKSELEAAEAALFEARRSRCAAGCWAPSPLGSPVLDLADAPEGSRPWCRVVRGLVGPQLRPAGLQVGRRVRAAPLLPSGRSHTSAAQACASSRHSR